MAWDGRRKSFGILVDDDGGVGMSRLKMESGTDIYRRRRNGELCKVSARILTIG